MEIIGPAPVYQYLECLRYVDGCFNQLLCYFNDFSSKKDIWYFIGLKPNNCLLPSGFIS